MTNKPDIYQTVTDAIIDSLEAGRGDWQERWQGLSLSSPLRATGEHYRGINALLLGLIGYSKGYANPTWMTFNQAKTLGGMVRKGEKSSPVVFFKEIDIDDPDAPDADDDGKVQRRMARGYRVFNVDQIDGLPDRFAIADEAGELPAKDRDERAEAALRSSGAVIEETGDARAYYQPSADRINMPHFDRFYSTGGYLATLAHELTHWTGAAHRLDREGIANRDLENVAFEELIAEIGAAFICARLGVAGDHIDSHAGMSRAG